MHGADADGPETPAARSWDGDVSHLAKQIIDLVTWSNRDPTR